MLVTFSINPVMTPEKLKKVDKLVSEMNEYNRECGFLCHFQRVNRGRNIAPPLPCRKPCRVEQIPGWVTHPHYRHGVCSANTRVRICELRRWELAHKSPREQKYSPQAKFPDELLRTLCADCLQILPRFARRFFRLRHPERSRTPNAVRSKRSEATFGI